MKSRIFLILSVVSIVLSACNNVSNPHHNDKVSTLNADTTIHYPQEKHLKNIKQLTFGGDNAEAYFSFNDKMIVFQAKNKAWGSECDQIYYFRFSDGDMKDTIPTLLSNGLGRTTCSYFMPVDSTVLYASTRSGGDTGISPIDR